MKVVVHFVALLCVAALAGVFLWHHAQLADRDLRATQTAAALRQIEQQIRLRAALEGEQLNERGFPTRIDPAWFNPQPGDANPPDAPNTPATPDHAHQPRNTLVSRHRPWMEIADLDQAGLRHPRVRQTLDDQTAAFWYNPFQGVVRARVPVDVSDARATDLYNRVNGTTLRSILDVEHVVDAPLGQPPERPEKRIMISRP